MDLEIFRRRSSSCAWLCLKNRWSRTAARYTWSVSASTALAASLVRRLSAEAAFLAMAACRSTRALVIPSNVSTFVISSLR